MTPRRIDRGRQPSRTSDSADRQSGRSNSGQKRRSASRGRDQVDSKKGRTDTSRDVASGERPRRVKVGIDWDSTGIEGPGPRSVPHHPSFRPDRSGASKPVAEPRVKSMVVARSATQSPNKTSGQRQQPSQNSPPGSKSPKGKKPTGFTKPMGFARQPSYFVRGKEDPEKVEVRDKAWRWIAARANRLDPREYEEETRSLRFFGHQQVQYGMEMIAIVDWARKYINFGMRYPLPVLPEYLFSPFASSKQMVNAPLIKPELTGSGTQDLRAIFKEGWILTAAVFQFWTDKQSILEGVQNGGRVRPTSALAEYVLNSLNLVLPQRNRLPGTSSPVELPGSKSVCTRQTRKSTASGNNPLRSRERLPRWKLLRRSVLNGS